MEFWRAAHDISGDRMATRTLVGDDEKCSADEEGDIYIMRLK
jgi:hypothetical protein